MHFTNAGAWLIMITVIFITLSLTNALCLAEYYWKIVNFCHIVAKVKISHTVISKFTGLNSIKSVHNVSMPINILKSELQYSNPLWNTTMLNEGAFGCNGNVPWRTRKMIQINHLWTDIYHLVNKIVKIIQVGPEIVGLQEITKK